MRAFRRRPALALGRGPALVYAPSQRGHGSCSPACASSAGAGAETRPSVATSTAPSARSWRGCRARSRRAHAATASARPRAHPARRRARAASVSSVWLIVPRPGSRGDQHRQPQRDRKVAHAVVVVQRHQQPADALDDGRAPAGARAAHRVDQRPRLDLKPARRAARCGDTAGPKRSGETSSGRRRPPPQAARGRPATRPPAPLGRPVTTGL